MKNRALTVNPDLQSEHLFSELSDRIQFPKYDDLTFPFIFYVIIRKSEVSSPSSNLKTQPSSLSFVFSFFFCQFP